MSAAERGGGTISFGSLMGRGGGWSEAEGQAGAVECREAAGLVAQRQHSDCGEGEKLMDWRVPLAWVNVGEGW